jgi:ketosteroid isomerase-like protein
MADEELNAVRRIYASFVTWDFDEMARDISHDFELTLPDTVPFGGTRHGPDGIRSFARIFRDHLEAGFAEPDDFLDAGDRVVVLGRIRGEARSTGRRFEVPFAHVWTFSDGMPSRLCSYFDTAPVVSAIEP